MGSQIRCVVLMGLWLIGSGAAAQEVVLRPFPCADQPSISSCNLRLHRRFSHPTSGQGLEGYGSVMVRPMPTILHQDPRDYQLGSGGSFRRSWHAVCRVLITRSDSGKAQPNISELGGAAAAAAISGQRAKSWQCGECVDHTDGMGFAYVYD